MANEHLSKQYDADLSQLQSRVLQMGGLVEQQLQRAAEAFGSRDSAIAQDVVKNETRVNEYEVEIDDNINHIIARRQPTAGDLRMVMAISKSVTDLERMGDEAAKLARLTLQLAADGASTRFATHAMRRGTDIAATMLRTSLDSFARLDAKAVEQLVKQDAALDAEFQAILRELITYVMEDPRNFKSAVDTVLAAKAVERIGDHAKNIAENVFFIVRGEDIRHTRTGA
jgi:phosphate transport system protein